MGDTQAKELRLEFIQYLNSHYHYARPGNMASNVLYTYYHDIGMPFGDIFSSSRSMDAARQLLESHFAAIGRKDPKGHAAVHYGCWLKFREFLQASGRTVPDGAAR
ncbi:hypothetical protein KQI82_11175 [Oscillibacter sp. MSJ-2]|uniref:Uncharacterized protein n=1 Tax=Dysosmobacter acutus TaxID=2841504 RepID=A0ABS6FBN2_9FIRM|nr:hypothetical protein [Dysosmobacter acutus]MBU5627470.1 hypothetical protein [Dysosmobacter acutus]